MLVMAFFLSPSMDKVITSFARKKNIFYKQVM